MTGYVEGNRNSMGDLPDNVIEVLKGLDIDWERDYGTLPDLDEDFTVVTQGGDDHVTHEGLIDMAHRDGLALTYTEPVAIPDNPTDRDSNPVVFRAIVATNRGVFTAYGDAHDNDTMVDAVIRMAETRAVSRALRAAVNVGSATAPEMPNSADGVQVDDA